MDLIAGDVDEIAGRGGEPLQAGRAKPGDLQGALRNLERLLIRVLVRRNARTWRDHCLQQAIVAIGFRCVSFHSREPSWAAKQLVRVALRQAKKP
jgi:hypothetical protein